MRLLSFLLFAACLQVAASGYSQITMRVRNLPLEKTLKIIEQKSGYSFFYDYALLKNAKSVDVDVKDITLTGLLEKCFKEQPITFSIVNKTIILKAKPKDKEGVVHTKEESIALPTAAVEVVAIIVSGQVTDAEGRPLAGASVNLKGATLGTLSDADGNFRLQIPDKGGILTVSYIGYEPYEIAVSKSVTLKIVLKLSEKPIDEIVAIGYGTRRKKDVTGAVSTMNAKEIEKNTALSPQMAMQGRLAGVFIESGGGSPSSRPTVRIRGVNTFGNAEPLYVVDGIPFYEPGSGITDGAIGDIRTSINVFSMINPADIESISVLKDASAAAIYGVRASNGVILITTKRGKAGRPRVEVNSSYGVQQIAKTIPTLNTQQYFSLIEEAYNNNPDANTSFAQKFGPLYDKTNAKYVGNGPTYNWDKEFRNNNASLQDHSVKVSGSSEAISYYFSGGYSKTESPVKTNTVDRYTITTNLDAKISRYISSGINVRLVQQNTTDHARYDPDLTTMMGTIPFQPIYDATDKTGFAPVVYGTFKPNPDYDPSKLDPGIPYLFENDPVLLWGNQSRFNLFAFQALNRRWYDFKKILGSVYLQIEPLKGLKVKGSFGGHYDINGANTWDAMESWRFTQTPVNPYAGTDGNAKGRYTERLSKILNINKELTINYNTSFAQHHTIDILLGASEQLQRWNISQLSANSNYADPQYWAIGNQPPFTAATSGITDEDVLIGYVGRVSYNYNSKYYFDASMRRDGSSKLAPGYKWNTFPSFAVAWRVSSEKFFPQNSFINDLKLKGGWGRLGNFLSAGAYQYLSLVSLSPDYSLGSGNGNPFGTQYQGARLPNFANTTLTWEKAKTTSVGLDALMFNSKVSFTAEYYNKTTYDIIQSVALPPNTGIENQADLNVATVRNKGFEFQLGYNNTFGAVNFNANANLTTVNNKVLKLNAGTPIGGSFGRVEEGYSMFYLWGYKVDGIFQSQQEIDAWKVAHPQGDQNIGNYAYQPGDMYFKDVYGNPVAGSKERYSPVPDSLINDNDRTYLGKTIPGYYYGFSLGAEWKGFDINVFFQGVGDVQKYNFERSGLEGMSGIANQRATVLQRWTPTHPSTEMPRAIYGDPAGFTRVSSRFVENASYMRLKNVQIGYRLPATVVTHLKFLQSMRLYVSGVNLLTFTKYSGLDPESSAIPPTRQIIVGVNVNF